jgi:molybdopterin-guanine dinucleotide biosynthesis protein A
MSASPLSEPAPLLGLVLAGGRSSRMKRDKATLRYHGISQLDWACQRLAPFVQQVFVSVRADQRDDPARNAWPQVVDQLENAGPMAGIAAAQALRPDAAWLVLACDLPFLDAGTLQRLCAARDAGGLATAFRSEFDGLPEPLCAIYEPRSREQLAESLANGRQCPRKFLLNSGAALLDLPSARALDNVNSSEEYVLAMNTLAPVAASLNLKLQYYALLREQAGRSEELLQTNARTPAELYAQLRQRYPFTLEPQQLRVAINSEFADWSQPLCEGDSVVFIPPVAGG